jgi:predicted nucleic acid-binding protein
VAVLARCLVDPSALARMRYPAVAEQLAPLIEAGLVATCPVIDMEVLFSTRSPAEYVQVREDRSRAYEYLPVDERVWRRAEAVQAVLAQRSQLRSVGIPGLLIAAVADLHRIPVLHYDADYEHVAAVTEQEVRWVVPRGSVP